MKTLRLIGKLLGISLIVLGFSSSCKKDKNCITCNFTYEDEQPSSETVCEGEQQEYTGEDITWEEFVNYAKLFDETSEYISCDF